VSWRQCGAAKRETPGATRRRPRPQQRSCDHRVCRQKRRRRCRTGRARAAVVVAGINVTIKRTKRASFTPRPGSRAQSALGYFALPWSLRAVILVPSATDRVRSCGIRGRVRCLLLDVVARLRITLKGRIEALVAGLGWLWELLDQRRTEEVSTKARRLACRV